MKLNKKVILSAVAVALTIAAGGAVAGTTGTEFQALYTWVNGLVTGYFGKAVSVGAVGAGAVLSMAKVQPMPILAGMGFAVFLQYTPTIITGILTATI